MPRNVQITVPSERTDHLVAEIRGLEDLIGLQVQRGISIYPPGDVVSVSLATSALHELMRLLDQIGLGHDASVSAMSSDPLSMIAAPQAETLTADVSEATWEEMELTIAHESNMTVNGLLLMAASGILAAVGISTNAVHLVIGAMAIAPGFEPISRISLGVVAGGRGWRRGLADAAKGYVALAFAAGLTALALQAMGTPALGGKPTYLATGVLTSYWTSVTVPGLIVAAVASAAGAILLTAHRSILTAGVMIALALIPTAAIAGMAVAVGELEVAGGALLRWGIDVAAVALFSALVFLWKRFRVQRRKTAF